MIGALLLTLLVGIFFFIGMLIPKLFKKKDKLILFTTGLTMMVILSLIFLDLLPEIIEIFELKQNPKYIILILIFILLGIFLLKMIDLFIPEHHHEHHEKEKNKKEHNGHLCHIGLITSLSLIIHNILEGITIYITGLADFKLGLFMALSVGCHNLPLGIEIAANLEANNNKKLSKWILMFLLIFSSSLGALFLFICQKEIHFLLEGILLSLTLGMLIYIGFFELFGEVKTHRKEKELQMGIIIGILLTIILFLI